MITLFIFENTCVLLKVWAITMIEHRFDDKMPYII